MRLDNFAVERSLPWSHRRLCGAAGCYARRTLQRESVSACRARPGGGQLRERHHPRAQVTRTLRVSPPVVRTGLALGPALLQARGLKAEDLVSGK